MSVLHLKKQLFLALIIHEFVALITINPPVNSGNFIAVYLQAWLKLNMHCFIVAVLTLFLTSNLPGGETRGQ